MTPAQLLGFPEALAHDLIHRRCPKCSRNGFVVALAIARVWNELVVGREVSLKLAHGVQELLALQTQGVILKEELEKIEET